MKETTEAFPKVHINRPAYHSSLDSQRPLSGDTDLIEKSPLIRHHTNPITQDQRQPRKALLDHLPIILWFKLQLNVLCAQQIFQSEQSEHFPHIKGAQRREQVFFLYWQHHSMERVAGMLVVE